MSRRKTTEEFILESRKIHGDRYDYSLVEYRTAKDKVTIICPKHGQFSQKASNHTNLKQRCPKCFGTFKKNNSEFIKEATLLHQNKFNYDLVEYKRKDIKVKIKCNTCLYVFSQKPESHIGLKQGCPYCYGNNKKDNSSFIKEARVVHGNKFNYDLADYKGNKEKVLIKCNTCLYVFSQKPNSHLMGNCCPKCYGMYKTTEEVIDIFTTIHGNKYNYDLIHYKNTKTKMRIYCNKCKKYFMQNFNDHKNGAGCPFHIFKTQSLIYSWLISKYPNVDRETIFEDLPNARFDFYLEDYNLVIELDGPQHFKQVANWDSPQSTQAKDKLKMDFCLQNGLSMIRLLQEDVFGNAYDWRRLLKKNIKCYKNPVIRMYEWGTQYDVYGAYATDYVDG